jgi:hypothetical protein
MQDRPAVRLQRLQELVRGGLADDDEDGGGPRLHQVLHASLEVVLDPDIPGDPERCPHDASGHAD